MNVNLKAMNKEQFIKEYCWYPKETAEVALESVIQQAIAAVEAEKWKKFPWNRPEKEGDYLVQLSDGNINLDHYHETGYWDMVGKYVIAFRELPTPYQPEGRGE